MKSSHLQSMIKFNSRVITLLEKCVAECKQYLRVNREDFNQLKDSDSLETGDEEFFTTNLKTASKRLKKAKKRLEKQVDIQVAMKQELQQVYGNEWVDDYMSRVNLELQLAQESEEIL